MRRFDYQQVPPKVEYALTEQGQTLFPMVQAIHVWGENHARRCLQIHQSSLLKEEM
ncbi:winged helix-turn-helix transcriptional regulator [Alkanindiges illinoisensis]|uniref:HTH hxlR-type domain-containing protein n=1 Tax=Alkanindiges illinoisensis TaxID=197183 RepID=A0A4Y7XAI7_9GAMM|nr:hypothetical protein E2B99_11785 [Alkanindiges illinoisensis]